MRPPLVDEDLRVVREVIFVNIKMFKNIHDCEGEQANELKVGAKGVRVCGRPMVFARVCLCVVVRVASVVRECLVR